MHGHNWKVEVEVQATELDSIGMGVDFKVIKQHTREITDGLDHRYLNEIEPFDRINPTAENIAAYIFEQVSKTLNTNVITVTSVTLWETDRACVRYQK